MVSRYSMIAVEIDVITAREDKEGNSMHASRTHQQLYQGQATTEKQQRTELVELGKLFMYPLLLFLAHGNYMSRSVEDHNSARVAPPDRGAIQ